MEVSPEFLQVCPCIPRATCHAGGHNHLVQGACLPPFVYPCSLGGSPVPPACCTVFYVLVVSHTAI
jgi:hypothetical protein